ncbi:MAG: CvpA family protein [Chloroflexi bacterium]|nr:CvpA family protein [Chloroflexota bacterium]
MNWLDIVILIILGIATFSGLRIGIIKAALSLAGMIAGVILAGRYYIPLAGQLSFIPQDNVAKGVAFAIILIGTMLIASTLAMLLKWAVSAVMLGWVNHLGGAAFGLVLGAIFCGALLATAARFLGLSEVISQSSLATILLDRFPAVLALLPDEFDTIRSFFE